MAKKRNLGIDGDFWWVWAIATFIFIAFWGYLYLPLVLVSFVALGIYFLVFDRKSDHQKFDEQLSENETFSAAPAGTQTLSNSKSAPRETTPPAANAHFDVGDLPIQANLCGHPKATVIFIESVGAKVQRGQIVMRFEVLSARLNKALGLAEYAERQGILEPLVQVGDEILDKQAIYRIRATGN